MKVVKSTFLAEVCTIFCFLVFSSNPLLAQMDWKEIQPPRSAVNTLFATKSGVVLAFDENTFYRSSDRGQSWSENSVGFPQKKGQQASSIVADEFGTLYALVSGSDSNTLVQSDDEGKTWSTQTFEAGGLFGRLSDLHLVNNTLYGTYNYRLNGRDTVRTVVSKDKAQTFALLDAPQSVKLMTSGGILFGLTVGRVNYEHLLWEYSPQTGKWTKIFDSPKYDIHGQYHSPRKIAALPSGERFLACSYGSFVKQNLYYSSDAGQTWNFMFQTKFGNDEKICHALVPLNDTTVAILFDFHTDNNIDTALRKRNGNWELSPLTQLRNRAILRFGGIDQAGNLYAFSRESENSSSGILRLPLNGSRWVNCGLSGQLAGNKAVFADSKNRLFVCFRTGEIYRSDDEGALWQCLNDNLPEEHADLPSANDFLVADDDAIYVRTRSNNAILASKDGGITWKKIDVDEMDVAALYLDKNRVFVAGINTDNNGIAYEISDGEIVGGIVLPYNNDIANSVESLIKLRNSSYLLRVRSENMYRISDDDGQTWDNASFPPFPIQYELLVNPIEMSDGVLYTVLEENIFNGKSIYRSTDSGKSWTQTEFVRSFQDDVRGLTVDRAGIPYIIDGYGGIIRFSTTFDGAVVLGLKDQTLLPLSFNAANNIYTANYSTVYKGVASSNDYWERTGQLYTGSNDKRIISIGSKQNNEVWIASTQAGTLRSANNGGTWNGRDMKAGMLIFKLFVDSRNLTLNCTNNGVYLRGEGIEWEEKNIGLPTPMIMYDMLEDAEGIFYVATFGDGIYRSKDKGGVWEKFSAGIRNDFTRGLAIDVAGGIYAITNGGIYVLHNGTDTWTEISGNLGKLISGGQIDVVFGNQLYCYTDKKMQRATIGSVEWSEEWPESPPVNALSVTRNGWLMACTKDGLWRKTTAAAAWERFGLAGKEVLSFGENAAYFFAGVDDQWVYRLSKGFVGAEGERLPTTEVNARPNPADNELVVSLPSGATELTIVDISGNIVVRHELSSHSGDYRCSVSSLPSGMYVANIAGRLGAQSFVFVKP